MKHLGKLAFGAMALMFVACSDDKLGNDIQAPDTDSDRDFYASLTLRLPSAGGSRADNSSYAGEEFGQDDENYVGTIFVVLAKKNDQGRYKWIADAKSDARPGSTQNGNKITYTLNFKSDALGTGNPVGGSASIAGEEDVYVFAYCNPSTEFLDNFQSSIRSSPIDNMTRVINDMDNALLWQSNHFLMTNKSLSKPVNIPDKKTLVDNHNTADKAFNLGTIDVVRAAARFDFKLGGYDYDKDTQEKIAGNKYDLPSIDDPEKTIGTVELTDMAMFNIQKRFYYLHRTSPADTKWNWLESNDNNEPNYELCGDLENYVMSYNLGNFKAPTKNNGNLTQSEIKKEYYYSIIDTDIEAETEGFNWTSIKPEAWNGSHKDDNHNSWDTEHKYEDYKIWRYTSENTIPAAATGGPTSSQKVGVTTGVVFKGEFIPAENDTMWNNNVVYVYNNIVYGDFKKLAKYVADNKNTVVAGAFKEVSQFKNVDPETADLKVNLLKNVPNETDLHGFTAYEPTKDSTDDAPKYRMYYFYYNRHDSNNDNSVMGENEFGVVRNNVYKLCVTKIGGFGQPTSPKNPDDPNEEENAYFTVSCTVWPWTVRLNNIEF